MVEAREVSEKEREEAEFEVEEGIACWGAWMGGAH